MAQTGFQFLGKYLPIQFAASTAAFLRCYIDASGYAAIADASKRSVGVATTGAPAWSGGTSINTLTINHQVAMQTMVANGAISIGQKVYAAASGKVSGSGNVIEGIAFSATTTDGDYVQVVPSSGGNLNFATTAASTAVTANAVETTFGQTYTIPAGSLSAGDSLDVFVQGIATTFSSGTLTVKVKIGSTIFISTGAVTPAANDIFVIQAKGIIRTSGASGTLVVGGLTALGTPGEATNAVEKGNPAFLASTAIDTTVAQIMDVTGTWSAASNSARVDIFTFSRIGGAAF